MTGPLLMSQFLPILLGYSIIRSMFRGYSVPLLLHIALAYGLGNGILCQWMLVLGIMGIPYSLMTIGFPMAVVIVFFLIKSFKLQEDILPDRWYPSVQPGGLLSILGIFFVFLNVLFVFWSALNVPVAGWDVVSVHGLVGKIIFLERSLDLRRNFPHSTYPLHVPFLMSWIALNLGQWHEQFVKIISPLAFLALLVVQYYFVRRLTSFRWAILSLALLCTSNSFVYLATTGYRETSIAYYFCATLIMLLFWRQDKEDRWLYLAGLFAGFLSFVKTEGVGYICILSVILLALLKNDEALLRKRCARFFKFILPAASIAAVHLLNTYFSVVRFFPKAGGVHNNFDLSHINFMINGEALGISGDVFHKMLQNLFLMGNWNIIWLMVIISFLVRQRKTKLRAEITAMLWSVAMVFFIYFVGFSFTQHHIWLLENDFVLTRSVIHFLPLAAMICIFNFYSVLSERRD